MLDHLMRRLTDLPLKNGGIVRLKPLSLRDMGPVLAEPDGMRRIAMAVQRSVVDGNGLLLWGPTEVDYIMDELDQLVVTQIGMWVLNGPGDVDPLSDSPSTTPTATE